jgi:dihydroflavonol-4-reductase
VASYTTIEPGDRVVITGASGFIGSAVARAVQARGAHIVALVQPGVDDSNLAGLSSERVVADIRDSAAVQAACAGARFVFHLAAIYRFWARDPRVFYEVNVGGTLNVLSAARAAGTERVVFTSTVGVLGLGAVRDGAPGDETSYADIAHLFGPYKRSKFVAEHEVLRACAEGLDVCLALPTFPLGPGDVGPTPTGRLVLDFLNGKVPAFVDTALNVAHVDDLALGHVAALEHGGKGRSYILGGENMSMRAILQALADYSGLPMPRLQVPRGLALAAGAASTLVQGRLLRREPRVPLEAARMSTTKMIFSDERSRAEIGYTSRPAREAIRESARWFADNGYVTGRRQAAIKWRALPGDRPEAIDEPAGASRGILGREGDDRVGSLRDRLGAPVPIEVRGGVARVGGIEADARQCLRVLRREHRGRGLGRRVQGRGDRRLNPPRIVGEGLRPHAAADVDHGRCLRLAQQGKERAGHAHDAGDIGREDMLGVRARDLVRGGMAADDPGVVDEGVDTALVRLDVGRGVRDRGVVGDVDRDEPHAETVGRRLAALGIPGADDHVVAQLGQPAGGLVAEALVGSGDEGNGGHESSIGRSAAGGQGCPDGRTASTTHMPARRWIINA